jgi:hypothetical protein
MKLCGAFLVASLAVLSAQVPSLSGTWVLNVDKSSWGKKAKPQAVTVKVEHNEPSLKYSGITTTTDGEQATYDLDTTIDAAAHPVKTSYGPGQVTMKRVNPYTVSSEYKSDDGKFQESATTVVSPDGKTMTRRMHTKGPDGEGSWTEVYDRQ